MSISVISRFHLKLADSPMPAPAEPSVTAQLPRYRWFALGILFLVSVLNTVDKMLIPALAEPLRTEFSLSDSELGLLIGLLFSVAYGLASIPMGMLIDRVNRTRLLAFLLLAWSVLTLLSAKTSSLIGLAACRVGVAAAESGGNPTTLSLLSDYFPKEERGKAIGIFSANSAIATVLVFTTAGFLATEHGWRAVFVVASIPGLILGALIFLTLKEPRRGTYDPRPHDGSHQAPGFGKVVKSILANKTLLWVTGAAVFVIIGQAGSGAFTATFFVRVHELSLAQAGLVTGVVLGGGFAIGTITGGFIADRASRKSAGGGCHFMAAVTLLAVPFGIIAFTVPFVSVSVVSLFLFQVLGTCFYGATLSTILELSPLSMRGSIMTYITLIMNLGGYGLGPQFTGILSDLFGWAGAAEPLRWGLVAIVCIMSVSASFYYIAARRLDTQGPVLHLHL
jgi:predicted MFS family arabinose efflux permease